MLYLMVKDTAWYAIYPRLVADTGWFTFEDHHWDQKMIFNAIANHSSKHRSLRVVYMFLLRDVNMQNLLVYHICICRWIIPIICLC